MKTLLALAAWTISSIAIAAPITGSGTTSGYFTRFESDLRQVSFTAKDGVVTLAGEPVEYVRVNGLDVPNNLPDASYPVVDANISTVTYARGSLGLTGQPTGVSFVYKNPTLAEYTANLLRFDPAPFTNVAPGEAFKLGTITVTNGIWFQEAQADITVLTHSTDPSFDGHMFTDVLKYIVTLNTPDVFGGTPQSRADIVHFANRPDLGEIRVLEAIDSAVGPNTGSIDLYGKIGSLTPLYFANPQGGVFLQAIGQPVSEPTTLALLGVALAGLGFSRRLKLH